MERKNYFRPGEQKIIAESGRSVCVHLIRRRCLPSQRLSSFWSDIKYFLEIADKD